MNPGEERVVCDLVSQVFHEFVAPDYGQEGIEAFFRFADPEAMRERMQSGGIVLVAHQADVLAGMLEFFPPDRIAMLFVEIQHQGSAKGLLTHVIRKARAKNPDLPKVTVHSSPYAEPIYLKMGFKKNRKCEDGTWNQLHSDGAIISRKQCLASRQWSGRLERAVRFAADPATRIRR